MKKSKTHFRAGSFGIGQKSGRGSNTSPDFVRHLWQSGGLEKCKIDEHGHAVHEDCYVHKLAGRRISTSSTKRKTAR